MEQRGHFLRRGGPQQAGAPKRLPPQACSIMLHAACGMMLHNGSTRTHLLRSAGLKLLVVRKLLHRL